MCSSKTCLSRSSHLSFSWCIWKFDVIMLVKMEKKGSAPQFISSESSVPWINEGFLHPVEDWWIISGLTCTSFSPKKERAYVYPWGPYLYRRLSFFCEEPNFGVGSLPFGIWLVYRVSPIFNKFIYLDKKVGWCAYAPFLGKIVKKNSTLYSFKYWCRSLELFLSMR